MGWTTEKEEKLKELWKKGLTGSEIAKTFNTTRSAILGKVHRLKLEARAVSKKKLATPKAKLENSVEIKQEKLSKKARFRALLVDKNFEPENPKKLEELTDQTCRYPIGHPSEGISFYFCGRKSFEKEVYCRLHLMLCFQPKNAMEDDIISEEDMPIYEKKIKSA